MLFQDAPDYIKALQRAWDEVEHKKMRSALPNYFELGVWQDFEDSTVMHFEQERRTIVYICNCNFSTNFSLLMSSMDSQYSSMQAAGVSDITVC